MSHHLRFYIILIPTHCFKLCDIAQNQHLYVINMSVCQYMGLTSLRLQDRINQHIPKSIRNNKKPTKILPKRNCKEKINTIKPLQLGYNKQTVRQQLKWPTIFHPCQDKKFILSLSIGSHLHQNLKTNSMSPERNRLFFTNFPLVSVSQHNTNSIAIFRHNIYFHQDNSPAFLSISLHFVNVRHIALNQSAA